MYYYFPEPPYFLVLFGLLAGITSGLAFQETLKNKVQEWSKSQSKLTLKQLQAVELRLPFLGICAGVCVFLASGLQVFSINNWLAYAVSLFLTILIAGLIWSQLGKLLLLLQQGGSKAIDLDSFE